MQTWLLNSPPTRTNSIPPSTTPIPTPNLDSLSPGMYHSSCYYSCYSYTSSIAPLLVSRLLAPKTNGGKVRISTRRGEDNSNLLPPMLFLVHHVPSALHRLRIPRRRQPTPRPPDRPYGRYTLPLIGTKVTKPPTQLLRETGATAWKCLPPDSDAEMVDLE
ncbi:hypothetical protein C8J56DRAFT_250397 [Mycena floridula]|nr:hypothetical protein C8J56DRAFT_250397 [Mycena floridula]